MMKIKHGLSDKELRTIKQVLINYATKIEKVGILGSRANGQYKHYSDIDIVLYGELNQQEINRINTLFDESNISLRVDVKNYQSISYPPLKRHMDEVVQILFTKEKLQLNDEKESK